VKSLTWLLPFVFSIALNNRTNNTKILLNNIKLAKSSIQKKRQKCQNLFYPHYVLGYRRIMATPRFIYLFSLRLPLQFLQRESHLRKRQD